MTKVKAGVSLAVLFICLQPFSFSQRAVGEANLGLAELSGDPIVDVHGNLLFFKTIGSKTDGVETEVTLISPDAKFDQKTYPGILSPIRRGEKAVYFIHRMPSATATKPPAPAALSLSALVTAPGSLPSALVDYALTGKFELFKVASGFLTGGTDVIYLGQAASTGASVLVLTFDGSVFAQVPGSPVPLS